jgi:putative transposase
MAIEAELAHQKILKRACRIWVQQRLSRIGVRRHRAEPHVPQKSNTLERFNEEIRRRTRVARIFPNEASCLRLVRALAVEQHERWQEDHRYLNMAFLKEAQRERLNTAA